MENNGFEKSSSYTAGDDIRTLLILMRKASSSGMLTLANQLSGKQQQDIELMTDSSISHTMATDKEKERDMKRKNERHVGIFYGLLLLHTFIISTDKGGIKLFLYPDVR